MIGPFSPHILLYVVRLWDLMAKVLPLFPPHLSGLQKTLVALPNANTIASEHVKEVVIARPR